MSRHKRTKRGMLALVGAIMTWAVLVTGLGHCCRAGPTGYVPQGGSPAPVGEDYPQGMGGPWKTPWVAKDVKVGKEGSDNENRNFRDSHGAQPLREELPQGPGKVERSPGGDPEDLTSLLTPQPKGSGDLLEPSSGIESSLAYSPEEGVLMTSEDWVFEGTAYPHSTWVPWDAFAQPRGDNVVPDKRPDDICMFLGRERIRNFPLPEMEGPDALEVFLRDRHSQFLQNDDTAVSVAVSRSGDASASQHLAPLPDGCEYLDRTAPQRIMCRGTNITDVPSFAYSVRNAAVLTFDSTGIQRLGPHDTEDLPRVSSLSFTNGRLFSLLPHAFGSMPKLQELSLGNNAIREWFLGIFVGDYSSSIRVLNLQDNRISFPPEPVHVSAPVLPHLETLILNGNPLCVLPGDLFQPLRYSPVTSLFLKGCGLNSFSNSSNNSTEKSPLAYLPNLQLLDLSINAGLSSEELTRLLAPLRGLTNLYLGNNNYHSVPIGVLEMVGGSLEKLDLHGSVFSCLDNSSFPTMPRLTHLNLMYCRIRVVQEHTFDKLTNLTHINLDGNILTAIPSAIILPTLQELTLNQNPRDTGDGSPNKFVLDASRYSQDLGHLNNLSLSQVPLKEITVMCFKGMHHVTHLHLELCQVEVIYPKSFIDMSNLMYLWLRGNNLRVLDNNTFVGLEHLLFLDLSDNRIGCYSFTVPVGPPVPKVRDLGTEARVEYITQPLQQPLGALSRVHRSYREQNLRKNPVDSVLERGSPQELVRWFLAMKTRSRRSTPQGGTRHSVGRYNHTPFTHLRRLETLDLSGNKISILDDVIFSDLAELLQLNLSNNDIEGWDEHIFSKMKKLGELILRYNRIRELSSFMMDDLRLPFSLLDLRDNMLTCSCPLRQMDQFWNSTDYVKWDGVCYTEKPITATPMADYLVENDCSVEERTDYSAVIASAVVVTVILVTAVTTYKKRWYLRYLAYSARLQIKRYREDVTSYRHAYDAFVSYAMEDRQWVFENLLTKLEEGGRYRVCIHERDFTAGQVITENIVEAIEKSRKVILVISRAFVASPWCMFELQIAAHKILDERRNKAVLLLLESVPHEELPKHLRVLMKMRTYIAWVPNEQGQRLFWARLLRAVAKPSDSENVVVAPECDAEVEEPQTGSANDIQMSTQVITPSSSSSFSSSTSSSSATSLPSFTSADSLNLGTDLQSKRTSSNTLSCPSIHPPSISASRTSLPPYKVKSVDSGFSSSATSWSELSAGQLFSMSSSRATSAFSSSRTTSAKSSSSIPSVYHIPPSFSYSSTSPSSSTSSNHTISSPSSFSSSLCTNYCVPSSSPSSSTSLSVAPIPSSSSIVFFTTSSSMYSTASLSTTETTPSGVSTITSNTEVGAQTSGAGDFHRDFLRVKEDVNSL